MSDKPARAGLTVERGIFLFLFLFFAGMAAIYWFTTYEIVGGVALTLSALLCLMVLIYVFAVGRSVGRRLEDDKDAEVIQGAGDLGFFPPKSIWPLFCALTVSLLFLGPVFGWWITFIAVGIGIWSVSGWVFEFYRGDYAH